jgi:hypothetical protein
VITEDDVRRIAGALPGAYEQASYDGQPSWRTKPRMFTWIRSDPAALVVWVGSVEDKEALIASEPEKFFTTPHYDGHPTVLVRFNAIDVDELAETLTESWRIRAPKKVVAAFDLGGDGDGAALAREGNGDE